MSAGDDYPFAAVTAATKRTIDAYDIRAMLREIDRLHTWGGLMWLLDLYYPPDVFDGSSGDPGPRIVVLTREIDRLRADNESLLARIGQAYVDGVEARLRLLHGPDSIEDQP